MEDTHNQADQGAYTSQYTSEDQAILTLEHVVVALPLEHHVENMDLWRELRIDKAVGSGHDWSQ